MEGDLRQRGMSRVGAGDELELSMPFLLVMGCLSSLKQGEQVHSWPAAALGGMVYVNTF